MITKSEKERQELFKKINDVANQLRNKVDGWDFKAYILGFLFYRYLSEDFNNYANQLAKESNFNYQDLDDEKISEQIRTELINNKGYFIYPSQLFQNIAKLNYDQIDNLNEQLASIFKAIENSANETSRNNLKGLFDDINLNSEKLGRNTLDRNKHLLKIIKTFNELDFDGFSQNSIDIFGDAYEYLIRMYASNAGKSGGEFYTPQEVSELLFKLAIGNKTRINKIYDPACGSGSLLLKARKIIGANNVVHGFYGQEVNITAYNLSRINMFLHGINFADFHIAFDDTLIHPQHLDHKFDLIVSNPPYSTKWEGKDNPLLINDVRYAPAGVLAPRKNSDFAFIMHALHHLSNDGKAAIVCFPGIMFRSGAEQKIRKYLVDNNFVDLIIQLPENLFYGTTISTCIMVLSKSKENTKTMFINASEEYEKVTNSNQLSSKNIDKIIDHYLNKKELEHFSKLVDNEIIANNNYELMVSKYVQPKIEEKIIDIQVINNELVNVVNSINSLRNEIDEIIKEIEDVKK